MAFIIRQNKSNLKHERAVPFLHFQYVFVHRSHYPKMRIDHYFGLKKSRLCRYGSRAYSEK